jgi:hypothetical protein
MAPTAVSSGAHDGADRYLASSCAGHSSRIRCRFSTPHITLNSNKLLRAWCSPASPATPLAPHHLVRNCPFLRAWQCLVSSCQPGRQLQPQQSSLEWLCDPWVQGNGGRGLWAECRAPTAREWWSMWHRCIEIARGACQRIAYPLGGPPCKPQRWWLAAVSDQVGYL